MKYIKLIFIKDRKLVFLLDNKICHGVSNVIGDRFVESNTNKKLHTDANFLYGWATSQFIPTGEFQNLSFLIFDPQKLSSRRFVTFFGHQRL